MAASLRVSSVSTSLWFAAFTTTMDGRQVLEKELRAIYQRQKRTVMIGGQRIDAFLDIGEVAPKQGSHIRPKPSLIRHGRVGAGTRPFALGGIGLRCRKPPHRKRMRRIPNDPGKLARAIGGEGCETGEISF